MLGRCKSAGSGPGIGRAGRAGIAVNSQIGGGATDRSPGCRSIGSRKIAGDGCRGARRTTVRCGDGQYIVADCADRWILLARRKGGWSGPGKGCARGRRSPRDRCRLGGTTQGSTGGTDVRDSGVTGHDDRSDAGAAVRSAGDGDDIRTCRTHRRVGHCRNGHRTAPGIGWVSRRRTGGDGYVGGLAADDTRYGGRCGGRGVVQGDGRRRRFGTTIGRIGDGDSIGTGCRRRRSWHSAGAGIAAGTGPDVSGVVGIGRRAQRHAGGDTGQGTVRHGGSGRRGRIAAYGN